MFFPLPSGDLSKLALAQRVVTRTNSRDIIHQTKISLGCDEPAPVWPYRRQLVKPSTTFSCGRLVRVKEAGGLMRPRSKPDSIFV